MLLLRRLALHPPEPLQLLEVVSEREREREREERRILIPIGCGLGARKRTSH